MIAVDVLRGAALGRAVNYDIGLPEQVVQRAGYVQAGRAHRIRVLCGRAEQ